MYGRIHRRDDQEVYLKEIKNTKKGDQVMAILEGKKAIIIGDRDGIPGPAIAECVKSAGADIVYSSTECFV